MAYFLSSFATYASSSPTLLSFAFLFCDLDQHIVYKTGPLFFLPFFSTPTCIPLPSVINTYLSIPSPFLLFFLATARHNIRLISYPFHSLSFDLDLSIFFSCDENPT